MSDTRDDAFEEQAQRNLIEGDGGAYFGPADYPARPKAPEPPNEDDPPSQAA